MLHHNWQHAECVKLSSQLPHDSAVPERKAPTRLQRDHSSLTQHLDPSHCAITTQDEHQATALLERAEQRYHAGLHPPAPDARQAAVVTASAFLGEWTHSHFL